MWIRVNYKVRVFTTTFYNISVISCQSVYIMVEETGIPRIVLYNVE